MDVEEVEQLLLGDWPDVRRDMRELMKDPRFHKIEGLTSEDQRERSYKQLIALAESGSVPRAFPAEFGGQDAHGANIASFEELVTADPFPADQMSGVQWGLFGAAVMHLGSKEHHARFLPGIMDLSVPGAYAMTEFGHGSDVAALGTTATYDPDARKFVVHTPFTAATKRFLGNAARHAQAAVVFAQLITQGVNHGVHCFYMDIRDDRGEPLDGITISDDGHKGGLNGVDNGQFSFDQVRIPRTNLLYAMVTSPPTAPTPPSNPAGLVVLHRRSARWCRAGSH